MSDKPISDLRRRMITDMTVRTFSDKTQHDYIRHVEAFARFLGRSPDTAPSDDIRRFQLLQVEQGAQPPAVIRNPAQKRTNTVTFERKTRLDDKGGISREVRLVAFPEAQLRLKIKILA